MQKNIPCDLCGAVTTLPYLKLVDHSPFALVKCSSCGLIFLDPRPDPVEINNHYSADYYTSHPPEHTGSVVRNKLKKLAYSSRCNEPTQWRGIRQVVMPVARSIIGWRANRRVPPLSKGRLLDVGCGNGEQAAWLRDNLPGWEVEGVEINKFAAGLAESLFSLKVYQGHLPDLDLPSESYDMVSFWHSLEHTFSPTANMKVAHRVLRRGGWVGIEVPDIYSWEARLAKEGWYHLAVPFHLYHFTLTTLEDLLKRTGFLPFSIEYLRGDIGLNVWLDNAHAYLSRPQLFGAKIGAQALGRFSPWGIRIYAAKT